MLSETDKYKLYIYNHKEQIHSNDNCDIYLVQSSVDNKLYIKRVYKNSDMSELFSKIKNKKVRYIPEIYEIFYDDKDTIVIEEYIMGHTGDSINFNNSLLFKTINHLLCSMEDLHSINIIHRDIKPSNIIITEDHRIYLIDFGIARFYSQTVDSDTTQFGTKGYASPEQYGFKQTDFRSDIYSIGKTIEAIINSNNISCNLKKIISKATAFDPDSRYSSISELRRAIFICRFAPFLVISLILFCILGFVIYFLVSNKQILSKNMNDTLIEPYDLKTTEETTVAPLILEETTQIEDTETTTMVLTEATTTINAILHRPNQKQTVTTTEKQAEISTQQNNSINESSTQGVNENINIQPFILGDMPYSGIEVPYATPVMQMLGDETYKACKININNTYINAECIKNGSNITVNLSDREGHKSSLTMSYSEEELKNSIYPDTHSFNAYIVFINTNTSDNTDILVNFTDYIPVFSEDGKPYYTYPNIRYLNYNLNKLMFVQHSYENGFKVYNEVISTYAAYKLYAGDGVKGIYFSERDSTFIPENGVLVEYYPAQYVE